MNYYNFQNSQSHPPQFFPTWVAPNVMTFAGWILLAVDFGLMSHYDWNFTAANGDTVSMKLIFYLVYYVP